MWFKVMMSMSVSTGGGYSACATTCSTTDAATLATCRFYRWERFLSTFSARPRCHVPRGGAAAAGARHSTASFILFYFILFYFILFYFTVCIFFICRAYFFLITFFVISRFQIVMKQVRIDARLDSGRDRN